MSETFSTASLSDWISADTQFFVSDTPLALDNGETLRDWQVAYRTWGTYTGDNAVLVCHALTGSADVDDWWAGLLGTGRALDPERDFIVCSNVIGGCYGSTGPQSIDPATGSRYGANFPIVTIRDMVAAQASLLDFLGVDKLEFLIGPSLGGMQVLEWASSFPARVRAFSPIGVSAQHSAWCIGTSEAQRQAIYRDPNWQGGNYEEHKPPADGFSVARMMAMLSYRSWANFENRFGRELDAKGGFSIQSYLNYQGDKICQRFDALSYVRLTQAMDSHDIGRDRGGCENVLGALEASALVVSVDTDVLYPPVEQVQLAGMLKNVQFETLPSPHGHDGFLIDTDTLSRQILEFRKGVSNEVVAAIA